MDEHDDCCAILLHKPESPPTKDCVIRHEFRSSDIPKGELRNSQTMWSDRKSPFADTCPTRPVKRHVANRPVPTRCQAMPGHAPKAAEQTTSRRIAASCRQPVPERTADTAAPVLILCGERTATKDVPTMAQPTVNEDLRHDLTCGGAVDEWPPRLRGNLLPRSNQPTTPETSQASAV